MKKITLFFLLVSCLIVNNFAVQAVKIKGDWQFIEEHRKGQIRSRSNDKQYNDPITFNNPGILSSKSATIITILLLTSVLLPDMYQAYPTKKSQNDQLSAARQLDRIQNVEPNVFEKSVRRDQQVWNELERMDRQESRNSRKK